MTYTEDRCERSEQHSRAEQVNEPRRLRNPKDFRQLRTAQDPARIHKAIIEYQFQEIFQPHWFGSIQWQPFITDYASAVKEARHFRNKFLCALLDAKPKKIPNPPERPRIIWFHEKAPVNINPQDRRTKHMTYSIHDTRPLPEREEDLRSLDAIQAILEDSIVDFALEDAENLYDEDNQGILRKLEFSKVTRSFNLVIAPDGYWHLLDGRFPLRLLMEIQNALIPD